MIKNIVFDMGKVLVNYDSSRVCKHFIEDEATQKKVEKAVFVSPEWLLLDMGLLTDSEGILRMQSHLDTEYEKKMAGLCMEHWHEYCMWAKEGMDRVVRGLKENGYGIYLCSNASARLLSCYKKVIPGIELFDGVLFSAEVKCMKPQKEMYEHLFKRFDLKPEECFFIDDLQMNIDGAKACGMDGYCFVDGDADKLRGVLNDLNDHNCLITCVYGIDSNPV